MRCKFVTADALFLHSLLLLLIQLSHRNLCPLLLFRNKCDRLQTLTQVQNGLNSRSYIICKSNLTYGRKLALKNLSPKTQSVRDI